MSDPYLDDDPEDAPPPRKPRAVVAGIAVLALAAFGGMIWYAYDLGTEHSGALPVITAQEGPVRRLPEDPGGEKVEHTDKSVYNVLEGDAGRPKVERLLPPPETPMPKPPAPAEAALATPEAPAGTTADNAPAAPEAPAAGQPGTAPSDRAVTAAPGAPPQNAAEAQKPGETRPAETRPAETRPAETKPPESKPEPKPEPKVAALPPDVKKPAPTPKAGSGPVRVQFGAYRTEEEARQTWTKLRSQNGDLLGRLAYMTESVQRADGTVLHRVQGGTLSDAAAAQFLCDQMKARKVDCIVVKR